MFNIHRRDPHFLVGGLDCATNKGALDGGGQPAEKGHVAPGQEVLHVGGSTNLLRFRLGRP